MKDPKPATPKKRKPVRTASLMDPDYQYVPVAAGVDVQKTWRRYGWVPPSEVKNAPAN